MQVIFKKVNFLKPIKLQLKSKFKINFLFENDVKKI